MGYTTPRTWSAGETVDEDHLNEQIRDNMVYLKTEADKIDDISFTKPSRTKDTIYQNSTKTRVVSVVVVQNNGAAFNVEIGSATPPTDIVFGVGDIGAANSYTTTFFVPPSWYYRVRETAGTITVPATWSEWDLLQ